jgi:hypothetical protein
VPAYPRSIAVALLFRDLISQTKVSARHTSTSNTRHFSLTDIIIKEFAHSTEVLPHAHTTIDAYLSYLAEDRRPLTN